MARFGLFVMGGGVAGGKRVVPEGWFEKATQPLYATGGRSEGYGYQWWVYPNGAYAARGLFGQGIFIDPARKLVIAMNANWRNSRGRDGEMAARDRFFERVQAAVDAR